MADIIPSHQGPITTEAFIADRQRTYTAFTRASIYGAAGVAALLILLAIFLL